MIPQNSRVAAIRGMTGVFARKLARILACLARAVREDWQELLKHAAFVVLVVAVVVLLIASVVVLLPVAALTGAVAGAVRAAWRPVGEVASAAAAVILGEAPARELLTGAAGDGSLVWLLGSGAGGLILKATLCVFGVMVFRRIAAVAQGAWRGAGAGLERLGGLYQSVMSL